MEFTIERDWEKSTRHTNPTTSIDTLMQQFEVTDSSDIPASTSAHLEPVEKEDSVEDRPYRSALGGSMRLVGVTRSDIAKVTRPLAR